MSSLPGFLYPSGLPPKGLCPPGSSFWGFCSPQKGVSYDKDPSLFPYGSSFDVQHRVTYPWQHFWAGETMNLSNTSHLEEPSHSPLSGSTCRALYLLCWGTWGGGAVTEETPLLCQAGLSATAPCPLSHLFQPGRERTSNPLCHLSCLPLGLSQGEQSVIPEVCQTPWQSSSCSPPPRALSLCHWVVILPWHTPIGMFTGQAGKVTAPCHMTTLINHDNYCFLWRAFYSRISERFFCWFDGPALWGTWYLWPWWVTLTSTVIEWG